MADRNTPGEERLRERLRAYEPPFDEKGWELLQKQMFPEKDRRDTVIPPPSKGGIVGFRTLGLLCAAALVVCLVAMSEWLPQTTPQADSTQLAAPAAVLPTATETHQTNSSAATLQLSENASVRAARQHKNLFNNLSAGARKKEPTASVNVSAFSVGQAEMSTNVLATDLLDQPLIKGKITEGPKTQAAKEAQTPNGAQNVADVWAGQSPHQSSAITTAIVQPNGNTQQDLPLETALPDEVLPQIEEITAADPLPAKTTSNVELEKAALSILPVEVTQRHPVGSQNWIGFSLLKGLPNGRVAQAEYVRFFGRHFGAGVSISAFQFDQKNIAIPLYSLDSQFNTEEYYINATLFDVTANYRHHFANRWWARMWLGGGVHNFAVEQASIDKSMESADSTTGLFSNAAVQTTQYRKSALGLSTGMEARFNINRRWQVGAQYRFNKDWLNNITARHFWGAVVGLQF